MWMVLSGRAFSADEVVANGSPAQGAGGQAHAEAMQLARQLAGIRWRHSCPTRPCCGKAGPSRSSTSGTVSSAMKAIALEPALSAGPPRRER